MRSRALSSLKQLKQADAQKVEPPKPTLSAKEQVLAAIEKTGGNIEETKKEVSKVIEQIKVEQPQALQEIAAHSEQAKQLKVAQDEKLEVENQYKEQNQSRKLAGSKESVQKPIFLKKFKTHQITRNKLKKDEKSLSKRIDKFYRNNSNFQSVTVRVKDGDTLQSISHDLYFTTRRWPELYLLNRDVLSTWDRVEPNMQIKAYVRVEQNNKKSTSKNRLSNSSK